MFPYEKTVNITITDEMVWNVMQCDQLLICEHLWHLPMTARLQQIWTPPLFTWCWHLLGIQIIIYSNIFIARGKKKEEEIEMTRWSFWPEISFSKTMSNPLRVPCRRQLNYQNYIRSLSTTAHRPQPADVFLELRECFNAHFTSVSNLLACHFTFIETWF